MTKDKGLHGLMKSGLFNQRFNFVRTTFFKNKKAFLWPPIYLKVTSRDRNFEILSGISVSVQGFSEFLEHLKIIIRLQFLIHFWVENNFRSIILWSIDYNGYSFIGLRVF